VSSSLTALAECKEWPPELAVPVPADAIDGLDFAAPAAQHAETASPIDVDGAATLDDNQPRSTLQALTSDTGWGLRAESLETA
jgi:hypothetical protein